MAKRSGRRVDSSGGLAKAEAGLGMSNLSPGRAGHDAPCTAITARLPYGAERPGMSADRPSHPSSSEPTRGAGRRLFLASGLIGAGALATGVEVGARNSERVRKIEERVLGSSGPDSPPGRAFRAESQAIQERHRQQTRESVSRLKARYEHPVFGHARVWDLVEKLALCVDPTDTALYCTNQFIHVQQVVAAMERDGVTDRDLVLAAFTHDLGKTLLLTDEVPEHIVCPAGRIGEYDVGVGLGTSRVPVWTRGDHLSSRLRDHVPDHVAWLLRYHAISLRDTTPYMMAAATAAYADRYLKPFRRYDAGFKSATFLPRLDLKKYRALIEDAFPKPILI